VDEGKSIEIIRKMILHSKQNLKDQLPFYLWWGWVIFLGAIANFVMLLQDISIHYLVWPIAFVAGIIGSIVLGLRSRRKVRTVTFIDRAMGFLWSGWIAFLFLVLACAYMGFFSWSLTCAVIIGLHGLGTFVSGGILRFQPLVIGGIISFVISLVCIIFRFSVDIHFDIMLIALALSILISYLIPGYLLRKA